MLRNSKVSMLIGLVRPILSSYFVSALKCSVAKITVIKAPTDVQILILQMGDLRHPEASPMEGNERLVTKMRC